MSEPRPFLSTKEWVWLCVVIAGMAAAQMGALYQMSSGLHRDMLALDTKWQTRATALSSEIRDEIKEVRSQIPPDWFRSMVEDNRRDIRDLLKRERERVDNE